MSGMEQAALHRMAKSIAQLTLCQVTGEEIDAEDRQSTLSAGMVSIVSPSIRFHTTFHYVQFQLGSWLGGASVSTLCLCCFLTHRLLYGIFVLLLVRSCFHLPYQSQR